MPTYQGKFKEFLEKIKSGEISVDSTADVMFTTEKSPEPEKLSPPKPAKGEPKGLLGKLIKMAMEEEGKPGSTPPPPPDPSEEEYKGKFDLPKPQFSPWFSSKLKSIFKDNAIRRSNGNKRFGALDFKKLHRIVTTEKVFMRPERTDSKKYAVSLVVDCSGSMRGRKSMVAAAAAMTLIKEFQELTELEVMSFNEREQVLKKFDVKLKDDAICKIGDFMVRETHTSFAGGNHDHIALDKAAKSLSVRKGRRVMIVLSDGQPSCNCSVCNMGNHALHEALIQKVKDIRGQGIVPLSVGIINNSVEMFYPDYEVINGIDQLYESILRLLDRTVRRLPVK